MRDESLRLPPIRYILGSSCILDILTLLQHLLTIGIGELSDSYRHDSRGPFSLDPLRSALNAEPSARVRPSDEYANHQASFCLQLIAPLAFIDLFISIARIRIMIRIQGQALEARTIQTVIMCRQCTDRLQRLLRCRHTLPSSQDKTACPLQVL